MVEWPTRAQQSHRGRKAWRGEGREWCGRTSDRRERGASVAFLATPRRFSAVALRVQGRNGAERSVGPRRRRGWRSEHVWDNGPSRREGVFVCPLSPDALSTVPGLSTSGSQWMHCPCRVAGKRSAQRACQRAEAIGIAERKSQGAKRAEIAAGSPARRDRPKLRHAPVTATADCRDE